MEHVIKDDDVDDSNEGIKLGAAVFDSLKSGPPPHLRGSFAAMASFKKNLKPA